MDHSNHDWAYLEKFRLANEKLKVYSDENRIVFIGDSIIAGWNEHTLFKKKPHYINRGINGQTTAQILHRFQLDVIDLKPKVAVVLVGTNDIAENCGPITLDEIKENFRSIIDLALQNNIKVILCSILPVSKYYWNPKITSFEKISVLNAFLKSCSNNKTISYLDFYHQFKNGDFINTNYFTDGVHPNLIGYTLMSSVFMNHSTEFLQI
ncbi:GDSL-type esterase/lipase family protein [Flavobacterium antarcticum]|uniref:GDSL-type esterase/lipase family protein n=1 Tax=Flavobacterium antarcticum TaxID=271155 RepID=UPI0003B69FEC|nr:GDSL-type esterase/lipase family protein [Flavobacterium antarcticum]